MTTRSRWGPRWRDVAFQAGVSFLWNALFPRLAYWLRWPTRLRGRALLAYAVWNALSLFAFREWVLRPLIEVFGEVAEERAALRARLGHEPTDDEWAEYLKEAHGLEDPPVLRRRRS